LPNGRCGHALHIPYVILNAALFFSEYMCHVYVRGDNLAGVLISDHDYPHRVSHTLLTKVIAKFNVVI